MQSPSQLRDWTIYKITNPSGNIYIGKTFNLLNRVRQYKNRSHKNQTIIYRSILKHGWGTHKFEIIDSFNDTDSYASDKEMFWIRSWMTNKSKYPEQNGMNMTDGGEGTIGKPTSEYQKRRAREVHTGSKWNLGRKQSPETVAKRIANRIGAKDSEEVRNMKAVKNLELRGKPVLLYSKDGVFIGEYKSQQKCAEFLGVNSLTVSANLQGRVKTKPIGIIKNYILKYK